MNAAQQAAAAENFKDFIDTSFFLMSIIPKNVRPRKTIPQLFPAGTSFPLRLDLPFRIAYNET